MRVALAVLAALAACCVLGFLWLGGGGSTEHSVPAAPVPSVIAQVAPRKTGSAASPSSAAHAHLATTSSAPVPGPLPAALKGTVPDGKLEVDADGNLRLTPEVRWFFEYFFTATGEESEAQIRARIIAALRKRLPPKAEKQAEALLDRYIAYRHAGQSLSFPESASLADRLNAVKALRRKYLGADAEAGLFGPQEAADEVALQRVKVESDASLTPQQKADREQALEQELPPAIRAARAATLRPARLYQEENEMRHEGATEEDLYQFRLQTSGKAAADRLAKLDQQRAEWKARLQDFERARARIEASDMSAEDKRAAVSRLLSSNFSTTEQLRVEAIENVPTP